MNKILSLLVISAFAAGTVACNSDNILSKSDAESALNDCYYFNKDSHYVNFKTGYYEVNINELNELAQLQQAEMITFTVDKAVETVHKRHWSWNGSTWTTYTVDHYFAQVDITDKGKKFVIVNPVNEDQFLADIDKQIEEYEPIIPDYLNATYCFSELQSNQVIEESKIVENTDIDSTQLTNDIVEETTEEINEEVPTQKSENSDYESKLNRCNATTILMRTYNLKLKKVFNVKCTEEMAKNGKGSCMFVAQIVNETPFGYVLEKPCEDKLITGAVDFTHYQDRGWIVDLNN